MGLSFKLQVFIKLKAISDFSIRPLFLLGDRLRIYLREKA